MSVEADTSACHRTREQSANSFPFSHFIQIPEEVIRIGASLRTVDLSENKIKDVPPEIGQMKVLKNLKLGGNRIGE
jgi:Leucine-rich repeat (LRR) protein